MEPVTYIVNGQRIDAHGNVYEEPEDIPGYWAVTDPEGLISDELWDLLNEHFDSAEAIQEASDAEIKKIKGIGNASLEKIRKVIGPAPEPTDNAEGAENSGTGDPVQRALKKGPNKL